MSGGTPKVSTIPAGTAFVDCLAAGLLRQAGEDPLALSAMTVLLPNRRATRFLAEAFLRLGDGRPLLLPRMIPLGDLEAEELALEGGGSLGAGAELALAPAIAESKRIALLTQLVSAWLSARGQGLAAGATARLARDLARLIDEAETAEIDWQGLQRIVPAELADHWQTTLSFLTIVTEAWPKILAAQGALGPAQRRRLLLDAQVALWRRDPPGTPIVAAGSTGSIPAVARLLGCVARLPRGQVVLPGLDQACSQDLWEAIEEDPTHPQHGLARLLRQIEVTRGEVAVWPDARPESDAAALANLALRPAKETPSWRDLADSERPKDRAAWRRALDGIVWYDCADPRAEASTIALLLRGALETPGKTAALVTPDRDLARRVRAELARWEIEIDDSGGQPLLVTPPLALLRLALQAVAEGLAPEALLALLKHPLTRLGGERAALANTTRALERHLLRGPRLARGMSGLRKALHLAGAAGEKEAWPEEVAALIERLEAALAPLTALFEASRPPFAALLEAHLKAGEALAGGDALWQDEAGEAAAEALAEIRGAADDMADLAPQDYPDLFAALLEPQVVRPRWGRHPRLFLWGPLEARLQSCQLVILSGLNEGVWPAQTDPGPWLSRPMRAALGLPSPERRIGQAAHDLVQALAAREVVVTRAGKRDGSPTIPARWLSRLAALTQVLGLEAHLRRPAGQAAHWVAALDRPPAVEPCPPPAPRPPVGLRPRRLSVTRIETWMRNPYAIYARYVLGLERLPALGEEAGAAERGQTIHAALEAFVQRYPERLPEDPQGALAAIAERALTDLGAGPETEALWRPRLQRLLDWYLSVEEQRRGGLLEVRAEIGGRLELQGPAGTFLLTAKADRIERRRDGQLVVVDYKTGSLPQAGDVEEGLAPQLPLEGAIAQAGGFEGLAAAPLAGLEFWRLAGGRDAGEVRTAGKKNGSVETLAESARAGLLDLIAAFDRPETPYLARPRPTAAPRFDDYAHLARQGEWGVGGGEEE